MLPDDVFRDRLEATLVEVEAWATRTRDCASIDVMASPRYWRMVVLPQFAAVLQDFGANSGNFLSIPQLPRFPRNYLISR